MTLLTDCNDQQSHTLARHANSRIDTTGVTLVGTTLLNNNHFEGDLQHILVIPSPDAAYEQCYDYLPDCSQPFPYDDFDHNTNGYENALNGTNEDDLDDNLDTTDGSTYDTTYGSIDANIDHNIQSSVLSVIPYY